MVVRLMLLLSIVALVLTLWRLADVERQRYALFVGICGPFAVDFLDSAEPRTNRLWNLHYGLVD